MNEIDLVTVNTLRGMDLNDILILKSGEVRGKQFLILNVYGCLIELHMKTARGPWTRVQVYRSGDKIHGLSNFKPDPEVMLLYVEELVNFI